MRGRAIALGFLLAAVLLLLAEGVARLFPHRDRQGPRAGFVEPDPELIWRLPYRFQLDDPPAFREPQDRLTAHAEGRGLPFLDLPPHLARAAAETGEPVFLDASHLSVPGHAATARVLAERITALLDRE